MTKEWEPATAFDLFGDPLARCILVIASQRPQSAEELAEELNVSLPTVYRRINKLLEYNFLTGQYRIDNNNNQYRVFKTTLQQISFEIGKGGYQVDIQMKGQVDSTFGEFWTDLTHANSMNISQLNQIGKDGRSGDYDDKKDQKGIPDTS
jgi:predicted DNA-binding transcriptional regulator YafY